MAVADAVLPSPPPPPPTERTVVVRFALAPMLALGLVLRVAAGALACLGFATAWVASAASAAKVVARRAWGEGSAPFLQALTHGALEVCVYGFLVLLALAVLQLCAQCVAYVTAAVHRPGLSGSTSGFKKSAFRAIRPELVARFFRLLCPTVLGFVAYVAFILLAVAGFLVAMMSPHVEGSISQGEMVGSVIMDVGIFCSHTTACFVIMPALVLSLWREYQADRKAPSQFC